MDINELLINIKNIDIWPPAFKSGAAMWNDDYISRHMLAAHLDDTNNKASYKSELRTLIVNEIISVSKLKQNSTVLDLGCGPGLYAKEFTRHGIFYTGIDISNQSLGYAMMHKGEYKDKTHYIHGDYSEYSFADKYDLISMIWCDFGALSPSMRDAMLKNVGNALKPNGIFCFDVYASQSPFCNENSFWQIEHDGFWQKGLYAVLERNKYYKTVDASLHMAIVASDTGTKVYYIWDKRYNKKELRKVLNKASFEIISIKEGGLSKKQPEMLGIYCKLNG